MRALYSFIEAVSRSAQYWGAFLGALALTLLLVPACRRLSIAFGMVDMPGPRRINKSPIPRAGGLAVFLSVTATLVVLAFCSNGHIGSIGDRTMWRMISLSAVLVAVGFADDKFSLPPKVKLLGQLLVAAGAHLWAGVGFAAAFPVIPGWLDCVLTVFWIVGAINAFNLIDGLDGLASGISLIACLGISGSLFFVNRPGETLVYFALAGGCLGFLRYNFNPASVFLGDTGSMYLGFMISTLPLVTNSSDSLFVSVGVPVLAMGVPIFDTSLAIIRRTIRAALWREERVECGNGKVMQADADHLHHRILRRVSSQRTAAFILYAMAAALVLTGILGLALENRAVGLYIIVFVLGVVVVVRDMRRVELWDAGRLLSLAAHDHSLRNFRRIRLLAVPISVAADVSALFLAWAATMSITGMTISWSSFHRGVPLFVGCSFAAFVVAGVYRVVWGRAAVLDYARLACACLAGSLSAASLAIFVAYPLPRIAAFTALFASLALMLTVLVRLLRAIIRELFYGLGRLRMREDGASRVIAYGAGLRFAAFRREFVRRTGKDRRILVGILDDDPLLRGRSVGGIAVYGPLHKAADAVRDLHADTVVITCSLSPSRVREVADYLRPTGARIVHWSCEEREL